MRAWAPKRGGLGGICETQRIFRRSAVIGVPVGPFYHRIACGPADRILRDPARPVWFVAAPWGERMCGIAGIIGRLDETNAAALQRMNRALVHRGPDAEGSWQSPPDADGRGFLLTHRRLSILDLSPLGAQPMADKLTGDVIAYNGEVYNYVGLRDRLAASGHHFESTGDTAVVLRDLALNGASALPGLRGMFALAFWDADAQRLRLARDPLGIKPLY